MLDASDRTLEIVTLRLGATSAPELLVTLAVLYQLSYIPFRTPSAQVPLIMDPEAKKLGDVGIDYFFVLEKMRRAIFRKRPAAIVPFGSRRSFLSYANPSEISVVGSLIYR